MSKDKFKSERLKVLELLSKGKISADEAEKLLDALSEDTDEETNIVTIKNSKKSPFRMIKIFVDSAEGEKVRVQIPVEFAKFLKKGKYGNVDFNEMDIDVDALLALVENGAFGELVTITSEDGNNVRIVVE